MKIFSLFLSINDKNKTKHLLHTYLGFHSFVLWVWINNSMKYKQQWDIIDEAPYKIYWSPGGSWSVHRLHASETYQKYRHNQLYTLSNHRGCDMYKNAHTPCLLGASMLNSAALCHLHHGTGQISRLKHKQTPWLTLLIHTSQDTPCLPEQLHDQTALPLLLGRCWAVIGCLKMILKKGDRTWACSVDAPYPIRDNLTKT